MSKTEKVNMIIRISQGTKFQLKLTILICPKRKFPVEIALVHASDFFTYCITVCRQTQGYFNVSSPSSRRDNNGHDKYVI